MAESDLAGVICLLECETAHSLCASKLAEILEKILKADSIVCSPTGASNCAQILAMTCKRLGGG